MPRVQLTPQDRAKVHEWSRKQGYGASYNNLAALAKQHYNGNAYQKAMVEEKLTDINYHKEAEALSKGDYKEYERLANDFEPSKRSKIFADIEKGTVQKREARQLTDEEKTERRNALNARRREQRAERAENLRKRSERLGAMGANRTGSRGGAAMGAGGNG